jgi:hypothetical protein
MARKLNSLQRSSERVLDGITNGAAIERRWILMPFRRPWLRASESPLYTIVSAYGGEVDGPQGVEIHFADQVWRQPANSR